jgi:hypothetical protein
VSRDPNSNQLRGDQGIYQDPIQYPRRYPNLTLDGAVMLSYDRETKESPTRAKDTLTA